MLRTTFALALLLLASPALPLLAQENAADPVQVDSLSKVLVVRRTLFARRVEGRLIAADSQSITMLRRGREVSVPVASVRRMYVSAGRYSRAEAAQRGAFRGFLDAALMLSIYYSFSSLIESQTECEDCIISTSELTKAVAVPVLVMSTGLGAITGAIRPGERWVRTRRQVRVQPEAPATAPQQESPATP